MGFQLHETMYGKNFFEHQLPSLINALKKIAKSKTATGVIPTIPTSFFQNSGNKKSRLFQAFLLKETASSSPEPSFGQYKYTTFPFTCHRHFVGVL